MPTKSKVSAVVDNADPSSSCKVSIPPAIVIVLVAPVPEAVTASHQQNLI